MIGRCVMHKIILISLYLLLVFLSGTLTGCQPETVIIECTLLDCVEDDKRLAIHLDGDIPSAFAVKAVSASGESQSVLCPGDSGCRQSGVAFQEFYPKEVTIEVRWDGNIISETVRPQYSTWWPNGPRCPPECKSATVTIALEPTPVPTLSPTGMRLDNPVQVMTLVPFAAILEA
jgi:hypothetical protein